MTYGYNVIPSPTMTPGKPLDVPIVFFDDFLTGGTNKFGDNGVAEWVVTAVTATLAPIVQDDADGGWFKMATDDVNAGDFASIQLDGESFKVAAGRNLYFETKLKVNSTAMNALWGLSVTDTSPFASAPSDYIAFRLSDGADIEFTADTASGAPAFVDSGVDIVADTFVVLAFEWVAASSRIKFYVDGVHVGTKTTTIPLNTFLTPTLAVSTTTALTAVNMTCDYVLVVNDRAA